MTTIKAAILYILQLKRMLREEANITAEEQGEGVEEKEEWVSAGVISVVSYLRLLVNSRDELALARVVTGPGHGLPQNYFNIIKTKAKEDRMPMYQTIVSYVQQSRLGGKSYAPDEQHPFHEFQVFL